jgi:ribonuclease-3
MQERRRLVARLGYDFANPDLLDEALTHRSAAGPNNERLEFLGDAVLNFVIAAELYALEAAAREGDLSRLRASLVKGDTLAAVARQLDLGSFLTLGSGELRSGGADRDSILANALEAVLGAVFLDGGFEDCRRLIRDLFAERMVVRPSATELKDPKTRLQEYLQSRQLGLPSYTVLEEFGEAHRRMFKIACEIADLGFKSLGTGSSRRKAEQAAAAKALDQVSV